MDLPITLPTVGSLGGILLILGGGLSITLIGGFLWCRHALAAAGSVPHGLSPSEMAPLGPLPGRLIGGLAMAASLCLLSVLLAFIAAWVRPLQSLVRATTALIQGAWHRPVPISSVAIAPVQNLQAAYEGLRRALVDRLRSSTELNLQLESEVARRTAELAQRNVDLAALLGRLEATRSELLRTEKLATVGRVAAHVAGTIKPAVTQLAALPPQILRAFEDLEAHLAHAPAVPPTDPAQPPQRSAAQPGDLNPVDGIDRQIATLEQMDRWLGALIDQATQVSHVVRTLRVYARPEPRPPDLRGENRRFTDQPTADRLCDRSDVTAEMEEMAISVGMQAPKTQAQAPRQPGSGDRCAPPIAVQDRAHGSPKSAPPPPSSAPSATENFNNSTAIAADSTSAVN